MLVWIVHTFTGVGYMSRGLPIRIMRTIQVADGYLDLKMLKAAEAELQEVTVGYRTELPYLFVVSRLCFDSENWEKAVQIGALIQRQQPDEVGAWVNYAFAVRRHSSIEDAEMVLQDALERFPEAAIVPYNLACYASVQGAFESADAYFTKACAMDAEFSSIRASDEDLDPLREYFASKEGES